MKEIIRKYNIPEVKLITTPNKNIQSSFMKNEKKNSTDLIQKYLQSHPTKILLMSHNTLILDNKKYQTQLYKTNNFNTSMTLTECLSQLPKLRKACVCLIIGDFLTRSEIVGVIDYYINQCLCKAVLLIPHALAVCMGLKGGGIVVGKSYFSVVEENVLVEGRREHEVGFRVENDYDVTDEVRGMENMQAICEFCGAIEEAEGHFHTINETELLKKGNIDSINENSGTKYSKTVDSNDSKYNNNKDSNDSKEDNHSKEIDICICGKELIDDHEKTHLKYEKNEFIKESLLDDLITFINNRKVKRKIENIIFRKDEDNTIIKNQLEELDQKMNFMYFDENTAIEGAGYLMKVSLSQELWITDEEWWNGRIRVLREKVLFYI